MLQIVKASRSSEVAALGELTKEVNPMAMISKPQAMDLRRTVKANGGTDEALKSGAAQRAQY